MKKAIQYISILLSISCLTIACKKKDNDVSTVQKVSFPSISGYGNTYQGTSLVSYYIGVDVTAQVVYFSYPMGKAPALNISDITAYDSVTGTVPVIVEQNGNLNPNQPGLYIYQFSAKSKYGFASRVMYVIGVTDIDTSTDLSDTYTGVRGTDTVNATIQKMANGIYLTLDAAITGPLRAAAAYFVQTDNTHIIFPAQLTKYDYQNQPFADLGLLSATNGTVSTSGSKPVIQYTLNSPSDTLSLNGQTVVLTGQ